MAGLGIVRVRLLFDYPSPAIPQSPRVWLLLDVNRCRVVADAASIIRERFYYGQRGNLSLYLEDCLLPPGENIMLVRDNDCIRVKWEENNLEDDSEIKNTVSEVKSKKRRCQKIDDGVEMKTKKRKTDLKSVSDFQAKVNKKQITLNSSSSDESTERTKKADLQRKKKEKKLPKEQVTVKASQKTASKKTEGHLSSDSSSTSSDHTHETSALKKSGTATKQIKPSPGFKAAKTVVPSTANSATLGKVPSKKTSSSSSDTDSSKESIPRHCEKRKVVAICTPSPKNSVYIQKKDISPSPDLSDTLVIKKPVSGASSSIPVPTQLSNGNALVAESLQQGPLPNQGAMGRGFGRGRGDFPWRGPRAGGFRMRGGSGIPGRGRGDGKNFHYKYDTETPKHQQLNEPATNCSIIFQNPPVIPKKDYSALPQLAAPPQIGKIIAFKLLELTENYTPEVSDYKEGKIMSYDPKTQELELEILSHQKKEKEPGKFDLVYQSEDGTDIVEYAVPDDHKITQMWSSLIEPRLVMETPPPHS
ncbi:coilin [Pelodytes ibericus]